MKAIHIRSSLLAGAGAVALALAAGAAHAAEMTMFKQPNFTGPALTVSGEKSNLQGTGFYDVVSSIVVKSGRWQVCSQPNFQGDCVILERGQYATLDPKINHRIESVREVAPVVAEVREPRDRDLRDRDGRSGEREGLSGDRYADGRYGDREGRSGDRYADGRGRRDPGAIELFAGPSFRGRGMLIERDAETLWESGFEDRVSSLVVHEGKWQVCTRSGFEGDCRVLEPGRYATLGRFNNQIGSVRRVG